MIENNRPNTSFDLLVSQKDILLNSDNQLTERYLQFVLITLEYLTKSDVDRKFEVICEILLTTIPNEDKILKNLNYQILDRLSSKVEISDQIS